MRECRVDQLQDCDLVLSALDAPALLADTIESNRGVILVALGPLTNLAEAVQKDPEVLDDVAMMYLMGGAVDAGGNALENPDECFERLPG